MRRTMLVVVMMAAGSSGCPAPRAPEPGEASTETTHASTVELTDTGSTAASTGVTPTTAAETDTAEPWFEVGWGLTEFNAFEGVMPVIVGPQGLAMFSLPLRGQGFHNPVSPGFDDPEVPMVQAWVDVEGHSESPGGHLSEVVDYPALFYPTLDDPGVLQGVSMWLVIPDGVDPESLVGLTAHVHAEMVDFEGLQLVDDHEVVLSEVLPPPDGP